jgi:hypothetical protein
MPKVTTPINETALMMRTLTIAYNQTDKSESPYLRSCIISVLKGVKRNLDKDTDEVYAKRDRHSDRRMIEINVFL